MSGSRWWADPAFDVRLEPSLGKLTVEWVDSGRVIFSRRNELFEGASLSSPRRLLAAFPAAWVQRNTSRMRLAQRALRFSFYNVLSLRDRSLFVTFAKSVGVVRDGACVPLAGLVRPCRVLRGGCAESGGGDIFFGEYIPNVDRGPMHVYRYTPGAPRVDVAYTFAAGAIRHIHGIFRDPYAGALWCAVGDRGAENQILRTTDEFKTIDVVGAGDETWRAVTILFTPDAVYYAMDAEFRQNHLFRLDRRTGERTILGDLEGPVYYARSASARDMFLGVTAELCPSQQGRSAVLWYLRDGEEPRRVFSIEKDHWPTWYLLPGTLDFPSGPGLPDRFVFHTTALAVDNRTFSVALPSFPSSLRSSE